jgi:PAS domain S-box-containing protein
MELVARTEEGGEMTQARIMMVEDEVTVAADLATRLRKMGYAVIGHVTTGEEALTEAERLRPDLILMDIRLAGTMDGIEAATQIRHRLNVPVVFLTAWADDELVNRAKAAEPLGYMVKPYDSQVLRANVELALLQADRQRELKEREDLFRFLADSAYDWETWINPEGRFLYVSPSCKRLTGYDPEEFKADPRLFEKVIHEDDRLRISRHMVRIEEDPEDVQLHFRLNTADGDVKWIAHSCRKVYGPDGTFMGRRATNRDITEFKNRMEELRTALATLPDMGGLITVCSACRRVRDEHGQWDALETYLTLRANIRFSHGICPDCARFLYPDLYDQNK